MAAAFPNGIRCQKCLQMGHWTYECRDKRKYVQRDSRTKLLDKNLAERTNELQNKQNLSKNGATIKRKAVERNSKGQEMCGQDQLSRKGGKKLKKNSRKYSSSSSSSDTDSECSARSSDLEYPDDDKSNKSNSSSSSSSSSDSSSESSSSSSSSSSGSESDDSGDSSSSESSDHIFSDN